MACQCHCLLFLLFFLRFNERLTSQGAAIRTAEVLLEVRSHYQVQSTLLSPFLFSLEFFHFFLPFLFAFSPLFLHLTQDLKSQNIDDFEYHLLTNFAALGRKQKNDAEYVLAEFMKLLSDEQTVRTFSSAKKIES